MNYQILLAAGGIALVNIVLSGDNALVIGAAASRLPRSQRLMAIAWGGIFAVVLRLILSVAATELLQIPLLQVAGGIIIFILAIRLLLPENSRVSEPSKAQERLLPAIFTILVADVTMSLDNVLAVGALAAGNVPLLVIGLISSMILLFAASAYIARLMEWLHWLIDVAAIVLAWTAATLVLEDPKTAHIFHLTGNQQQAAHLGLVALIILIDLFIRAAQAHSQRSGATSGDGHQKQELSPAIPPQARLPEPPGR
ncbi:MAG: YjbE family putative metal transport protein [Ktedonobacterales bacterium]